MATYYVRSSGGNDGNAGTSFGAAFATLQKLWDTVTAGDVGLVCADGTYTPSAKIDVDTNAGTTTNPITIRGCAADGTDDGTRATISGASLPATTNLIDFSGSGDGVHHYANLRVTAATNDGLDCSGTTGAKLSLYNCRFDNNATHGVDSYRGVTAVLCEFDNNGSKGIDVSLNIVLLHACSIHDNTGDGTPIQNTACVISDCVIYNNDRGIVFGGATHGNVSQPSTIKNCTIFNNSGDGIQLDGGTWTAIICNNIIDSNGGYGIDLQDGDETRLWQCHNNAAHNNTSGVTSAGSTFPGAGHVYEDPGFANESAGSEDLTPSNENLKIQIATMAGTSYQWIGAIQPQASGGGFRRIGMQGGMIG